MLLFADEPNLTNFLPLDFFQIATLEIKSMNEKQRADHADSRYKLLQSQNSQIEKVIFLFL